ncbi:NAD(P)-dependent oxidoreductase [Herbaspirillum sp. RTI4]|uniref:NAD(P)-dependent oxidoreductase n=1 Tax=Herbaspirillum sp. RTI4 TaxID=3048640 RepID=UPI002AB432C5|nr:NAD(P)-dependent oxidoreductase [Herbaspirillum sp. RTI4]MDY7579405.1 NAD(P)-dependent oxidoreductase [Herbaspirillum sp. RTI4]MEA9980319.1 NAD(P)-dependent oxidoreductase [Herbaspirillum sp. RTI4]
MNKQKIAFVGLGSMGMPMAKNLLARGFSVCGFDMRAAAVEALQQAGGLSATSSVQALKDADVVILMVVNAAQAESILFAEGGLDVLADNAVVVLMATCAPGAVESIAQRVLGAGKRFIDAPVSGGVVGAEAATLTIMAAADAATIAALAPVFAAMGDKFFHVGERPGQGAMAKTVNQLLCGVHLAVTAEAISLATSAGIDMEVMLNIVGNSAASSWMLKDRGHRMLETEPVVTSAVDIFVKDLGIVMAAGSESKVALPFAALAYQLFASVSGRGAGACDDSQVIRAYRALNGG